MFRADPQAGKAVMGDVRITRDMAFNILPDSGRVNGNKNAAFSGITYAALSYMAPVSGATIASHVKFIFDNND